MVMLQYNLLYGFRKAKSNSLLSYFHPKWQCLWIPSVESTNFLHLKQQNLDQKLFLLGPFESTQNSFVYQGLLESAQNFFLDCFEQKKTETSWISKKTKTKIVSSPSGTLEIHGIAQNDHFVVFGKKQLSKKQKLSALLI